MVYECNIIGVVMSQEIDGTIAGIAELFCPDYYTRIKIRDVNPSPPKVVRSRVYISYFCRKIYEAKRDVYVTMS